MKSKGKSLKKRLIAVALSLIFLILVGVLFFRDTEKPSIPEQPLSLKSVFGGKGCENACWKDFEPFVASRNSVESWLNASGQDYSVVTMGRENDTLLWHDANESLLLEPSTKTPIRISMEFSDENILWRIALTDVYLCVDTVLAAYGVPDFVAGDLLSIQIGYPNEGLLLGMSKREVAFTTIFITSGEWVEYFINPVQQSWQDVQATLNNLECNDAFTAK